MSFFVCILIINLYVLKTSATNIVCSSTYDHCGAIQNSICSEKNVCECPTGFVLNKNNTKCLSYGTEFNSPCKDVADCLWLGENSICQFESCVCKDNYKYYQGYCKRVNGLGEQCNNDIICYDGYDMLSLKCEDSICVCNDNYYERTGTDCRKKATDICAIDLDCISKDGDKDIKCVKGKCEKTEITLKTENINQDIVTEILKEEKEENFEEEKGFEKDISITNCADNTDCTEDNTECDTQINNCVCKHGYFMNGEKCVGEIGVAQCEKDSDCPIRPAKCQNGICYCKDYWYQSENNQKCIKSITQNNFNCTSKEWCYVLGPNTYCNDVGSCECANNYALFREDFTCLTTKCYLDADCTTKKQNTRCVGQECVCDIYFHDDLGECVREINAPCEENEECTKSIDNSICSNSTCTCQTNYVQDDTVCIPTAEIGMACKKDVQCVTPNSICDSNENICTCRNSYKINNGTCVLYKEIGEYCSNSLECEFSGQSTTCVKSYCACPEGMSVINKKCTNSGSLLETKSFILLVVLGYFIMNFN